MMIGMPMAVVDRLEVLIHPFLGRLVVVRRDDEHRVGAGLLGVLGQFDRFPRRIGTGAGHDRHAALGLVDAPFHDVLVFVVRERRALAGGADRNKPAGALFDLPVDQPPERFLVDGTVLERGHERGERASKARPGGHGGSSPAGEAPVSARMWRIDIPLRAWLKGPRPDPLIRPAFAAKAVNCRHGRKD